MHNKEMIKKLNKLIEENPDLDVITSTYYEYVQDDWGCLFGNISDIDIEPMLVKNLDDSDCIYCGESDIKEHLWSFYGCNNEYYKLSDEEYNKVIDDKYMELVDNGDIVTYIIISINN